MHAITITLPHEHVQYIERVARLAGLPKEHVTRVILVIGLVRELALADARRKRQ